MSRSTTNQSVYTTTSSTSSGARPVANPRQPPTTASTDSPVSTTVTAVPAATPDLSTTNPTVAAPMAPPINSAELSHVNASVTAFFGLSSPISVYALPSAGATGMPAISRSIPSGISPWMNGTTASRAVCTIRAPRSRCRVCPPVGTEDAHSPPMTEPTDSSATPKMRARTHHAR